jgi:tetratricopeptide (TPR) repeat protein
MRVFAPLILPLFIVVALAAAGQVAEPSREYVQLCQSISEHAQAASRAFNSGNVKGAHKYFAMAEAAYKEAVALSPDHPYAFMNFGNLLSNANRFEQALHVLAAAMERLEADPKADPDAIEHVKGNIRRTLYGQASVRRDTAYGEGQGNITEARQFALQQLPLSPYPPRTLHDIATMELMLCDASPHMCESARDRLRQAQQVSTGFLYCSSPLTRSSRRSCSTCRNAPS